MKLPLLLSMLVAVCLGGKPNGPPRPPDAPSLERILTKQMKARSELVPGDIVEGDIILDNKLAEYYRGESRNAMVQVNLWPGGVVPYILDDSVDDYLKTQIELGIEEYHKYTCLRIVPRTDQRDYIRIVKPRDGCNSMVGAIGGEQVLNLGDGCQYVGLVIHEFGHAIGYYHEHNRPDRDDTLEILWDNIVPGFKDAFQKYTTEQADTQGLPHDLTSIMHYANRAFSDSGFCKTTMLIKDNRDYEIVPVWKRPTFSPQDIKKINKLYKCTTNTLPPVVQPGTNSPDPKKCKCEDTHEKCSAWAESGECGLNLSWMSTNCPKSCRTCGEPEADCKDEYPKACEDWSKKGECKANPGWMHLHCEKSCGICTPGVTLPPWTTPAPGECGDYYRKCSKLWVKIGECGSNMQWMNKNCAKSCRICGEPESDCKDNYPVACEDWARSGECDNNPGWMKHYCQRSCKVCTPGGGTQPPVTNAPETNPPATNAPVTNPPDTDPPVTNPPGTDAPVTNPPDTDAPVTNSPTGECEDVYPQCPEWKDWCNDGNQEHHDYMMEVCKRTCNFCGAVRPTGSANCFDEYPRECPKYKSWGWCDDGDPAHEEYMKEVCSYTCGCTRR